MQLFVTYIVLFVTAVKTRFSDFYFFHCGPYLLALLVANVITNTPRSLSLDTAERSFLLCAPGPTNFPILAMPLLPDITLKVKQK